MRLIPLTGGLFSQKAPLAPLAALAIAAASLSIMAPSVRAQFTTGSAQAVIEGFITPPKTINTASATALETAVSEAITSNTSVSPSVFAEAAIAPYPFGSATAKVRSDRNTSAGGVAEAAIGTLVTGSDTNFSADVAAIVDGEASLQYNVSVHGVPTATDILSTTGQATLVRDSLEKLADESLVIGVGLQQSAFLAAANSTGAALTADANLEALPKLGLITILQTGIEGITGARGKDQTVAPQIAENFVAGLVVSGSVPDQGMGNTVPLFAYDILARVAANTNVDELVANAIGTQFSSPTQLGSVAQELFAKYTSATEIAKVTQGLTAVVTSGSDNEDARVAFISGLLTSGTVPSAKVQTDAVPIDEGATFVDPYYASNFTQATFTALGTAGAAKNARKPDAYIDADAAKLALGEGEILGANGDELTQVATVFANLISTSGSTALPAADAGVYAADLINGAVRGETVSSTFGLSGLGAATPGEGGKLAVGSTTTALPSATAYDLAAIADVFADAIVSQDGTADLKKTEAALTALAEDIAKVTKNETTTTRGNVSVAAGVFLAATIIDYLNVELPSGDSADLAALDAAVIKGVTAVTDGTIDAEVKQTTDAQSQYYYTNYPGQGPISSPETTVTNL